MVVIRKYAMVQYITLLHNFFYAFEYTHLYKFVRKPNTEKAGFHLFETYLVFQCLFSCLSLAFPLLPLPLFPNIPVVFGFKVGRADVFCIVQVFSEKVQQINVVFPVRRIFNMITVSYADFYRRPIIVDIMKIFACKILQYVCLPCF